MGACGADDGDEAFGHGAYKTKTAFDAQPAENPGKEGDFGSSVYSPTVILEMQSPA